MEDVGTRQNSLRDIFQLNLGAEDHAYDHNPDFNEDFNNPFCNQRLSMVGYNILEGLHADESFLVGTQWAM